MTREAPPAIVRASASLGTVEQGPLVTEVQGPGTLEPLTLQWVTSQTAGQVAQLPLLVGTTVEADTVIAMLHALSVDQSLMEAQLQLATARTEMLSLQEAVRAQTTALKAVHTRTRWQLKDAERTARMNRGLGLARSRVEVARAQDQQAQLDERLAEESRHPCIWQQAQLPTR